MFEKKLAVCKINNTSYKGRNKVFDITPCAMKLLEQENEIKYGYIIINILAWQQNHYTKLFRMTILSIHFYFMTKCMNRFNSTGSKTPKILPQKQIPRLDHMINCLLPNHNIALKYQHPPNIS